MKRGDVVLVDFPFSTGSGSKRRPALVVQCDRNNGRLQDTIVAIITSNLSAAHEPTQYAIDETHPDWVASGLKLPSAVKCEHIFTFHQQRILRNIGHLSAAPMLQVNDCLKVSLELP